LFVKNISEGSKTGAKSGFIFSVGHTIVEFSLVIVLALGVLTLASEPAVKLIGIVGGAALLVFGGLQIREALSWKPIEMRKESMAVRSHLLVGTVFTGLNPYFILWWLTAGLKLISDSLTFGWAGIILMYVAHVWIDYAWLTGTAHLARRGIEFLGRKGYRVVLMLFGFLLIGFGLYFLIDALI
jgi:threonine/homoserine/homoserine lactone efflux protein